MAKSKAPKSPTKTAEAGIFAPLVRIPPKATPADIVAQLREWREANCHARCDALVELLELWDFAHETPPADSDIFETIEETDTLGMTDLALDIRQKVSPHKLEPFIQALNT